MRGSLAHLLSLVRRRGSHHLALVLGLLVMSVAMVRGSTTDSPTEDELTHMVRGIAYWRGADTRLSYAHPPLGNAWTALPVAWDAGNPKIEDLKGWSTATAATTTKSYVEKDYGYARAQLMRSRLAAMTFGLLLVTYVFYFCLSIFGLRTALASLVLLCLSPVVIAQCRYVTTDPPAMLGFTVGLGELIRYVRGSRFGIWRAALGVSLAMLSKYSGVTLIPVAMLTVGACALARYGIFAGRTLQERALMLLKHGAIAVGVILLSINLAYKFDKTGLTVGELLKHKEPSYWVSKRYPGLMQRFTPLPRLPSALPVPLPYTYLFGMAGIRGHSNNGFSSFFWGKQIQKAPYSYYPVMLGIKNPPSTLLLLGVGVVLLARRRRASLPSWILIGGSAAFLGVASRSNLAMGVRHLLPVIPALSILAGRAFEIGWSELKSEHLRAVLGFVLASTSVSAVYASPDWLGYFNFFAGGRRGGHEISIYGEDWGQDRERLANLVKARNLRPLYYDPQTPLRAQESRFLGMSYRPLRCGAQVRNGWVALHALTYRTHNVARCYPYLQGRAPDLDVNQHIYLWHITKPAADVPESKPDDARGLPEIRPDADEN